MQHTKQATKKAIETFNTDQLATMQLSEMTSRGIEPANAVRIIINSYIDGQGDFGEIVGWDEANQVDIGAVAKALLC